MSKSHDVRLAGLAVAWPEVSLSQAELAEAAVSCCCRDDRQARVLRELYRRCGVERRGCAILRGGENGDGPLNIRDVFAAARNADDRGPTLAARMAMYLPAARRLAVRAAGDALGQCSVAPTDIGHLVTVSCTGFAAPGVDVDLIETLGLSREVSRTHVGFMGCHAALNGWAVADALAARSGRPALLVCVEVCTAHFSYGWHPDRLVANALFGDGAAAAVLVPERTGSDLSRGGLAMVDRLSRVLPGSRDAMTWDLGDHGFEMTLGAEVPSLIRRDAAAVLLPWLETHGLSPDRLAGVIVHPGGPRVLRATTDALGLPTEAADVSRSVLKNHGNLSSPTVLAVLHETLSRHQYDRPELASGGYGPDQNRACWLFVAFGPGLAIEAMLAAGSVPS